MNDTFYDILPCGLQIVHRHTPSPVTYSGILIGAGTRHETPRENGMAHYIEHCVFKGCRTPVRELSAKQIIEKVEGVGGEINAYTTKEETVFYAASPTRFFARTLSLIAALVFQPTFPKKETDKEVRVIIDEIESYNDSPSELIYDDFESLLFQGHPLSLPILGTKRTLKNISRSPEEPIAWMRRHYLPERMVVFSQGNIPFPKVKQTVETIVSSFLPAYSPVETPLAADSSVPVVTQEPRQLSFRKHTHQTHIMLGSYAYPLGHQKQLTAYMLNHILGGGSLSSLLNMSLREKKGLVYTVESQYTPLSDTGYWNIYFACESRDADQCTELCMKELRKLREQPLSDLQRRRILTQMHGQMAISAENQENNFLAMGKQMLYFHSSPTWEETFHRLQQITSAELQEAANEIFTEHNLCRLEYD